MTTNQAEELLNVWAKQYEESAGEIIEPCFAGIEKDFSENKKIPHYTFADASVIVVFNDYFGRTHYVAYESSYELESEMDMESDALNHEYACVNIFE